MFTSIMAISLGAALGASFRWLLGEALNSLFPAIPPGTLLANVLGGYMIGIAVGVFAVLPEISPHWRLFAVTGFLGALTTFSTFSLETGQLIQQGRLLLAGLSVALHVCGSLAAFFAGIGCFALARHFLDRS